MRIGDNPQRDIKVQVGNYFHQVIIPVYIPHLKDYYKDSFDIFRLSLESLIITSHSNTFITVVANGCCQDVVDYISELHKINKIQEILITSAIGKLNSILKGLAGSVYPIITITDADVLFLNGWQKNTYIVFHEFPNAGVVSPVPIPGLSYYKTSNLLRDTLWGNKVKYEPVLNKEAVLKFERSIGNEKKFKEKLLSKCLTITSPNNIKAVVGAGHFIATYNATIFDHNFKRSTVFLLGGDSEINLLDNKALEVDKYRLSTQDNYAYHLGNTLEAWMQEEYNKLRMEHGSYECPKFKEIKRSYTVRIYDEFTNKIFGSFKIRKYFLEKKYNK